MRIIKTYENFSIPLTRDLFDAWNFIPLSGPSEHLLSEDFEEDLNKGWYQEDFIEDHGYTKVYLCGAEDKFGDEWFGTGDFTHDELDEIHEVEPGFNLEKKLDKELDAYLNTLGINYETLIEKHSKFLKTELDLDVNKLKEILLANKIENPDFTNFAYIIRYTFGERDNFVNLFYYKLNDGSHFFTCD